MELHQFSLKRVYKFQTS